MAPGSRFFPRFSSGPVGLAAAAAGAAILLTSAGQADAATTAVNLHTAAAFAVLGASAVTNTGGSVISGDVGVSPGTAITGFPPGVINNGTMHAADAVAAQAQADATTAYNQAAGESPVTVEPTDLGGQTLDAGVYDGTPQGGPIQLTGTVTLDGQGDPNSVFVFQTNSTLITATSSVVALVNGASACNVFWQVGSSATLGTYSTFVGTVDALTSVTADTGATIAGRLLARSGAVTLDTNTITIPNCAASTTTTTASPVTTTTTPVTTPGPVPTSSPVTTTKPVTTAKPVTSTTAVTTARSITTTTPVTIKPATTATGTLTTISSTGSGTASTTAIGGASPGTLGSSTAGAPLASTGSNTTYTAQAGLVLIGAGGLVLASSKRRRRGRGRPVNDVEA